MCLYIFTLDETTKFGALKILLEAKTIGLSYNLFLGNYTF
jgi:hypothetical protein